jgi:glycerophosphoryl diester phosphodiesterase
MTPKLRDGFLLTAHRGAVDVAPENTILAFTQAERLGIEEIELDVQITSDGVLVIGHDRTYQRVAVSDSPQVHIPVEKQTYAQIQTVDLGSGQRVPTFDEALDMTNCLLQVEIKAPRAAVSLANGLAKRSKADRDRCVVTSFHPEGLAAFQKHAVCGTRGIGLLVASLDTDWRFDVETLGVQNLYLHWPGLTRELVGQLQAEGFRVCASMFNHSGDLRRIIETGVNGSSTDRPIFARTLVAEVLGS